MDGKEDRIRQLAHEFWLEEGKPEGRAKEHWERARRQVESAPIEPDGIAAPEERSAGERSGRENPLPPQHKPAGKRAAEISAVTPKAKSTSRTKPKRLPSNGADEST
jgi:hypothetical protein